MDTNSYTTDHCAVADTCTGMGWYVDRRHWEELIALFVEEVLVDYTSLNGGEPIRLKSADLVTGWCDTLGGLTATQHLIAGPLVTVNGDSATCVANFQATHLGSVGGEPALWTLGGHYRFALTRRPDGWRISEVTMTAIWETGSREVLGIEGGT